MHQDQIISAQVDISDIPFNQDALTAAKGSGILFFGQILQEGSQVVFTIIVARSLGAIGYGIYNLGISVAFILATVAMLGLPEGMMRFLPVGLGESNPGKMRSTLFSGLGLSLMIGLAIATIFFGLANEVATHLFKDASVSPVIRLLAIIIPLEAIGRVLMGAAVGLKRMDFEVYGYSITFSLIKLGLAVTFLAIGMQVMGAVAAYIIAWIFAIGVLFYLLSRVISINNQFRMTGKDIRELVSFSAPLCLTELALQLRSYVDILLIGIIGTMASVGVYSAATRVQMAGNMLLGPITRVAKPIISDLDHQAEMGRLKRLYQMLSRWSLSFMLPLVITVILFPKPILTIFGDEFVIGVSVLIIIGLGMLVSASTRVCNSMISMTGHSRLTFINTFASLLLNFIFDLLLIPRMGIVGAALATIFAITIIGAASLLQVYWLLRLWPYDLTIIKPLFSGAVTLLVGVLFNRILPAESSLILFLVDVLVVWLSYIGITLLLGLNREDYMILSRIGRRFNLSAQR